MRRRGLAFLCVVAASFVAANGQPAAVLSAKTYSGWLPCADCEGIRTRLSLMRFVQGRTMSYSMSETWVGRPAAGTWRSSRTSTIAYGDAADKNATVYQLHTPEASSSTTSSFLRVSESELRTLDANLKELPATVPHTLNLVPQPVVRGGMAGGAVSLKVGTVMEVRLDANHTTGYSWIVAPVANPVLIRQGKAEYLDNTAENRVGAGGEEVWRFKAVKAGKQGLQFEYRRPWEKGTPPAKMVTFTVTVE
jgi:inhibitor of cysteine peptidase